MTQDAVGAIAAEIELIRGEHDLAAGAVQGLITETTRLQFMLDTTRARYAPLLADLAALQRPPTPAYASGLPWRSGYRQARNKPEVAIPDWQAFEAWRGCGIDITGLFLGSTVFSRTDFNLVDNYNFKDGLVQCVADQGMACSLAVPLLNTANARRYDLLAAGQFDGKFALLADRLAPIWGDRTNYIRLGWEMPEGYPWGPIEASASANVMADAAARDAYKAGFARVAAILRRWIPGVKIVWNLLRNTRSGIAAWYPGDEHVDVIGMDSYDSDFMGFCADDTKWEAWKGYYDPSSGNIIGVQGLLDFAKSRSKKFSWCEWGCFNSTKLPTHGSNNSFYVRRMFEFLRQHQEHVEYEIYFQDGSKASHQIFPTVEHNRNPSEAYLACYRP